MDKQRGYYQALWLTVAIVIAIAFVFRFSWPGLVIATVFALITFLLFRQGAVNPELEALRASLRVARDDIAQIIDEFDEMAHGSSTDAIADRTLTYPQLVSNTSNVPEIEDFHLRLASSRRFIHRVDAYLANDGHGRRELEKLIRVADQRATELSQSWTDARRVAKRLGPGTTGEVGA
ncbi:hypothetical protein [Corynebacterium aquatimens]|uniref:Uncharacterized protein n=1 Tax=Corynebacterium aquatimens TaxID=1190508 RepID=A0A931DZZ3_9CORY|nr:hypothetical protein [Corynebacterium aquatimens]MBG6121778.1 hypothetical protein [Corynebacterium aquatimens]WJY65683.1 hypothetical protein CAQUA_04850 [Corynebacterium aquatimens]